MKVRLLLFTLAAFGAVCAIWTIIGLLLTGRGGTLYLRASHEELESVTRRLHWLTQAGLLRTRIVLLPEPDDEAAQALAYRLCRAYPELQCEAGAEANRIRKDETWNR